MVVRSGHEKGCVGSKGVRGSEHSWKSSWRKRPLCPEAVASFCAHWHWAPVAGG